MNWLTILAEIVVASSIFLAWEIHTAYRRDHAAMLRRLESEPRKAVLCPAMFRRARV